jgi:hypothetical protein
MFGAVSPETKAGMAMAPTCAQVRVSYALSRLFVVSQASRLASVRRERRRRGDVAAAGAVLGDLVDQLVGEVEDPQGAVVIGEQPVRLADGHGSVGGAPQVIERGRARWGGGGGAPPGPVHYALYEPGGVL